MSMGELFVIIIIAILVMKPEDMINMLKVFKKLKKTIQKFQQDFFSHLDNLTDETSNVLVKEAEELNFYLKKIVDVEGNYTGKYSLPALKRKYKHLYKENNLSPPSPKRKMTNVKIKQLK